MTQNHKTKIITLDFETRSEADLKKQGAYKYSRHPSTKPTCLAFKLRSNPKVALLKYHMINQPFAKLPIAFQHKWESFIKEGYLFVAHNAFFETCIYKNVLVRRYGWPDIPFRQFRCTAAKAAACALPRNLAGAGEALRLTTQKDKRGYVAMMATCRPTKAWNLWQKKKNKQEPPKFLEPDAGPAIWNMLYHYCKIDVVTEELLDLALPDLIPFEQEVWFLNQKLNWRGLHVDTKTAKKVVDIMAVENKIKLKNLDILTMGLVTKPGSRQTILDFLAFEGVVLPDIRAQTVDDMLKSGKLSEDGKKLLEIRKALSKTSTKKYQGFLDRADVIDNRVRDILMYHGASTGRDTGTGIQPHNFPKGLIRVSKERPYAAVENVIDCDVETLKLIYGDNLSILFSSILRNLILPSDGCELFVADFAKIEVAVLWWLAGNVLGLKILSEGMDPYKYQASANTGKRYEDIGDDSDDRQLGKGQILGAGFGIGWRKFKKYAWDFYRLLLTDKQAKDAVKSYRESNPSVPEMWGNFERAAIEAVESKRTIVTNKCKFFCRGKFLWVVLPSGRSLAYAYPQVAWRVREYEVDEIDPVTKLTHTVKKLTTPKKTLEFWAVNSKTKKWALERTWGGTLTENIVQAVARDLMAHSLLNLERKGYKTLLQVHDEILTENKIGKGNLKEFKDIMCTKPAWADSFLPLDAKVWSGPRYRK